jgi:hypothetical protein
MKFFSQPRLFQKKLNTTRDKETKNTHINQAQGDANIDLAVQGERKGSGQERPQQQGGGWEIGNGGRPEVLVTPCVKTGP